MGTIGLIILLVAASILLSWLLTAGMCAVTASDWLCGHNAAIPFFIFCIASLIVLPMFWHWFRRPPVPEGPSIAVCSRCGAQVSFDQEQCPKCGFKFGAAA